jgi:hypothetical protein
MAGRTFTASTLFSGAKAGIVDWVLAILIYGIAPSTGQKISNTAFLF